MGKHWNENELDAFGHLNWTVGNADWIACFDAIRVGDNVRWHIVVDCESGSIVHTVESGEGPATMETVRDLAGLPAYWADICREQYPPGTRGFGRITYARTARAWRAHLLSLIANP
jgi:hypothetical protein